jgi:hypothetical protein
MKITPLFLFLGLFIIFLIPILFRNVLSYFSFKSIFEGMNTFESTKNTGDFVHIPLYSGSAETGTVVKIYDTIFFDTKNGNLIECEESATVPVSTGTGSTDLSGSTVPIDLSGATVTNVTIDLSGSIVGSTDLSGSTVGSTLTIPSASVPSASVPTASVPSASVTSTSAPSATLPTASVTSTTVPTESVPSATLPTVSVPSSTEGFSLFDGFRRKTENYGNYQKGSGKIEGFSGFKRKDGFTPFKLREGLAPNDPVQKIYGMTRDGNTFENSKTVSMDTSGIIQANTNTLSNAFSQHIYTTKGSTSSDSVLNNKYIVVYISWGQSTYLHVLVPDSAVIKLSAFYNVDTKQIEKTVYPRSGEPNTITLESKTPTGTDADNNKFIENLIPSYGHPLYQISPSVFYDKFNGQLVVSALNSENINSNVVNYPRTTNIVYDRNGQIVNSSRWSNAKTLPETTGFDSWVKSDLAGGVVIYARVGNYTVITNVKKTTQNQFIIGNIVRFDNNGNVISSSSSSATNEAQYNVIPPDDADDVYGGEYKKWLAYWHALMGATSSDDYLLKSQIVFPQNPYYNVKSCVNCGGCANCNGKPKVDDKGILIKDSSVETASGAATDARKASNGNTIASVGNTAINKTARLATKVINTTDNLARDATSGAVDLAKDTTTGAVGLAKDTVSGTLGLAKGALSETEELARDTVSGTVGLAKDTVSGTIGLAKDTVSGTANFAKDAVSGSVGFVKDIAYDTVSGTVGLAKDTVGGLLSTKNRSSSTYYDSHTPYGGPSYGSKPATSSRAPIDYLSNYGRMTSKGGDFIPITASFAAFGK